MAAEFPSEEWVKLFHEALNQSEDYAQAGANWTHGAVSLVVEADESLGVNEPVGIWLDIHQGTCREARVVKEEEAKTAPFCITADYARWKQVVKGELDPIKGMMQGKLKLKGNLPVIVRFVKASQAMVQATTKVETKFLDE